MRGTKNWRLQRSIKRRCYFLGALLALGAAIVIGRAVQLQVFNKVFLIEQAAARHLRVERLSAHRGTITDRNGEPLAVSTPVDSIWVTPRALVAAPEYIKPLAIALGLDRESLTTRLTRNVDKEFMYLQRHMNPVDAARIVQQQIPGVRLLREYRRYYPAGEVTGHLIGFTDIDDRGQEGMELAFDHHLAARAGSKRVLKDRLGRVVEDIESIEPPRAGRKIVASIDLRIQYLAYRELKAAVRRSNASSASAVIIDIDTAEVLAMVNQPSYNPNDRSQFAAYRYRNRAITDIFEPGSSFKPLIIAAALESGLYQPDSEVDTSPGSVQVGAKTIEDSTNLGRIDLATVLAQSSNVGATKIGMSLEPDTLWAALSGFGLGRTTASGFPGESAGLLSHYRNWRPISQATLAYGYGLSMTPLQLVQAYAVFAAGGLQRPVSLLAVDRPPIARRVIRADTAGALIAMLETVVSPDGTGHRAAVRGYRVAGKTGTTRKFASGGYSEDLYTAVFAGIVPTSNPRLAAVIVVDEPGTDAYYGGQVAAPVFAKVMAGALRILAIPPDAADELRDGSTTVAANFK
ncbi:MAG: penicillin-binding transpeptidase domain-containing protein [Pseudomonadota bacterium]|nr:penicillin-binding transpeptidase domain-containing protein [Pseudomonadota bacterium]